MWLALTTSFDVTCTVDCRCVLCVCLLPILTPPLPLFCLSLFPFVLPRPILLTAAAAASATSGSKSVVVVVGLVVVNRDNGERPPR